MNLDAIMAELDAIRAESGLPLQFAKGRTPLIVDGKPVRNPTPIRPKRRRRIPAAPAPAKAIGRVPLIQGRKIDRTAQAKLTRKPGSKVNPKSTLTPTEWLDSGRWVGVTSSNVKKVRYDKRRYELYVGFLNGSVYKYPGVDRSLARRFFQVASFGKAVWKIFRWPGRPYQRVA